MALQDCVADLRKRSGGQPPQRQQFPVLVRPGLQWVLLGGDCYGAVTAAGTLYNWSIAANAYTAGGAVTVRDATGQVGGQNGDWVLCRAQIQSGSPPNFYEMVWAPRATSGKAWAWPQVFTGSGGWCGGAVSFTHAESTGSIDTSLATPTAIKIVIPGEYLAIGGATFADDPGQTAGYAFGPRAAFAAIEQNSTSQPVTNYAGQGMWFGQSGSAWSVDVAGTPYALPAIASGAGQASDARAFTCAHGDAISLCVTAPVNSIQVKQAWLLVVRL